MPSQSRDQNMHVSYKTIHLHSCVSHWPLQQTDHSKPLYQICFSKHTCTAGYLRGKSVVLYTNAVVWILHVPTAPFLRWSTCPSRLLPLSEPCVETLATQRGPLFLETAVCLQAPQKHNANKSTLWRALLPLAIHRGLMCLPKTQQDLRCDWLHTSGSNISLGEELQQHERWLPKLPYTHRYTMSNLYRKMNVFFTQQLLPKSPHVWAAAGWLEEEDEGGIKTGG